MKKKKKKKKTHLLTQAAMASPSSSGRCFKSLFLNFLALKGLVRLPSPSRYSLVNSVFAHSGILNLGGMVDCAPNCRGVGRENEKVNGGWCSAPRKATDEGILSDGDCRAAMSKTIQAIFYNVRGGVCSG